MRLQSARPRAGISSIRRVTNDSVPVRSRRAWAIGFFILLSAWVALPRVAISQITYDRTTFVHGFNGNPGSWLSHSTPNSLAQQVYLGANGYLTPRLDGTNTIYFQRNQLRDTLNSFGGAQVLIGHSMGGLVARATLQANGANIAGIVTVGAPHEGTLLANNAGNILPFFTDVERRVHDAYWAIDANLLGLMHFFFSNDFPKIAALAALFDPNSSAIADLRTDSPTITTLDNQYDWVPHANVYGIIPTRNAVIRVAQSIQNDDEHFADVVSRKSLAKSAFKACKHIGYAVIVTSFTARKCAWADKVLGRMDERWATWVNGSPSEQAFDGVVSNSRTVYPGSSLIDPSLNFPANLVNHSNLTYHATAVAQIVNAMLAIGMQGVGPPPPPPTVFPVSMVGPTQVAAGCPDWWVANPNGGLEPYTYRWSAGDISYDPSSSNQLGYTGTTSGTISIVVTVTDSQGHTGWASRSVTVTPAGACY